MAPSPPKVFISYSHDSAEHAELVLRFAERLRKDGIDAQVDQYVGGRPPGGWPRWMLDKLDWADFVLLICTEPFYRRFRGKDDPDMGRGVDWEGQLITLEIYNSKSHTLKFIPVIFGAEDRKFVPEPLSDHVYCLDSEESYGELYSVLTGQAGIVLSELGTVKKLPSKDVQPLDFSTLKDRHSNAPHDKTQDSLEIAPHKGGRQPISAVAAISRPAIEGFEQRLLQTSQQRLLQISQQRFTFLLIGRTGVGKSSTVNSLFNEEIAPVGHDKPTTLKVRSYNSKNIQVIDTPGLCDDFGTSGNDKLYLSEIRKKVPEFHCCWFVTPLPETRLRPDERWAIRLITRAFKEEVWERSIIVFTFADQIPASEFATKLLTRRRMVQKAIREHTSSGLSSKIPAVAVSNKVSQTLPDGPWYEKLFTTVCERIAAKQALPFALTIVRGGRKLSLNSQQKEALKTAIRRSGENGDDFVSKLLAGSVVGGVPGAVVGGVPGAVVGGLLGGLIALFA